MPGPGATALKSPNLPCQTSEILEPAPWKGQEKNRKIMLKVAKSLCHCIQRKTFRLPWNTSSLGLIIAITDSDVQVRSQQSAGVNGEYSLLCARQKAICSFHTVVCRGTIALTLFSTLRMRNLKCFASRNS